MKLFIFALLCLAIDASKKARKIMVSTISTPVDEINFNDTKGLISRMETITKVKTHKVFLEQVLLTAADTNTPSLITEFFTLMHGPDAFTFQIALDLAFKKAAARGSAEVCKAILDGDSAKYESQLLLPSDRLQVALEAAINGHHSVLIAILDGVSPAEAHLIIDEVIKKVPMTSMIQLVLANKMLLLDLTC